MKINRFCWSFAVLFPMLALSQTNLKMKIVGGSPIVENVFVNGKGPFIFLLDTGAETNVIDPKLARQLEIPSSFHTDLKSAAGATRVP